MSETTGSIEAAVKLIGDKISSGDVSKTREVLSKVTNLMGRCAVEEVRLPRHRRGLDFIRHTELVELEGRTVFMVGKYARQIADGGCAGDRVRLLLQSEDAPLPASLEAFDSSFYRPTHLATFSNSKIILPNISVPDAETVEALGQVVDYISDQTPA